MANPRDTPCRATRIPRRPGRARSSCSSAIAAATTRMRLAAVRRDRAAASPAAARPRARHARPPLRGPPRGAAHGQLAPRRVRGARRAVRQARRAPRRAPRGVGGPVARHPGRRLPASTTPSRTCTSSPRRTGPTGPGCGSAASRVHPRLLRRIVRYGHGFHPLGRPSRRGPALLRDGARRGGPRPRRARAGRRHARRLPRRLEPVADSSPRSPRSPAQRDRGFTTFCIKPSQFVDDIALYPAWCREVIERVGEIGS